MPAPAAAVAPFIWRAIVGVAGFVWRRKLLLSTAAVVAAEAPQVVKKAGQLAKVPAAAGDDLEALGRGLREAAIGAAAVGAVYVGGRAAGAWK